MLKKLVLLALVLAGSAAGQERSPAELIKALLPPVIEAGPTFSCGVTAVQQEQRRKSGEAAEALVKLGAAAVPELESAIDSIGPSNAWPVLHVYARIRGVAAFPRLQAMSRNSLLESSWRAVADSAALSLGLTAYVPAAGFVGGVGLCRAQEPRDVLTQFIRAWERDNPLWVVESLGQYGRSALDRLLGNRTWEQMRAERWPGKSGGDAAVGYRFEIDASWAAPEETLGDDRYSRNPPRFLGNPEIDTVFKTASGVDCGRHVILFRAAGPGGGWTIDNNADLGDLLRLIGACAAAK